MIFNVGAGGGASTADKVKYDNTESGLQSDNVQGAVDELNSSLDKINTYVDDEGKLHFVDATGADTVLPFSGGWEEIKVVTLTSNLTIDIGRKPKELFVGWSATNVTTSEFNLLSYYNEDFTSYSFGTTGATINDNGFTITCRFSGRPVFYAYR